MKNHEFAMRIKAARKKLGLSQEQAAKNWGFSVGTLEAWEQEYRNPAGLYREKLEEVLRQIEAKADPASDRDGKQRQ